MSLIFGKPLELQIVLACAVYLAMDAGATVVNLESRLEGSVIEIDITDNSSANFFPTAEADLSTTGFLTEIVRAHGGKMNRFTNDLGATTTVVTLPRFTDEWVSA